MSGLFSDEEAPIPPATLADQIACVQRELGMRRMVYPRRVGVGQMTQETADVEIRRMEAVLATLQACQPVTPTEPGVFAWVPTDGAPALVLVNRRPSECSPGGVLNGHCIKPTEFYNGVPVERWGRAGRWVLLRSLNLPGRQS